MKSIEELKSGKLYSELSNDYVPKTKEDEAKLEARKQLTKEQLFLKLKTNLTEAISEFQNDDFLLKLSEKLKEKIIRNSKLKVNFYNYVCLLSIIWKILLLIESTLCL